VTCLFYTLEVGIHMFSSPKGKVSYCHHLVSVVCCPLTFHLLTFSSETLISKGDDIKSYPSFNSLGKNYLSFNRENDFLEINQPETRIACYGHVC
jgi:hypothetical protein